jgi:hypothetical protein
MPYVGAFGPLWFRAISGGVALVVTAVLAAGVPLYRGGLGATMVLAYDVVAIVLGLIGAITVLYGFRWKRQGIDDKVLTRTLTERFRSKAR